jgi:coatomer subunit beta'
VEGAFELVHELTDSVQTGQWVGDCFLFTNAANRLNYFVGGEIMTLSHLDHTMYMLGYLPKEDRVFLIDNSRNVVSFRVLLSVLEFQTAVVRQDIDLANELIKQIPESEHSSVARFLESQGLKEQVRSARSRPVSRDAAGAARRCKYPGTRTKSSTWPWSWSAWTLHTRC